jgi:hypothetical protein
MNIEAIDEAFEKIKECHDGHGRWGTETFDVGVTSFMEIGYTNEQAGKIMSKLSLMFVPTDNECPDRNLDDVHDHEIYQVVSEVF